MTPDGIELTWLASSHPTLRGYNVYRHIASESAIGQLNAAPLSENRYVDATAESGPVYEYLVTAVTVKGTESAYASITIVTEPGKTKAKPRELY
jgi:fibronectin type 3 domain-containing protein